MEDQMELVGAIGVEDKLQDGVKDTLVALGQAGIKVQSNLHRDFSQITSAIFINIWPPTYVKVGDSIL